MNRVSNRHLAPDLDTADSRLALGLKVPVANSVILDLVEPAQPYIIGYSQKKTGPVREAKFSSAIEALKTVDGLFRSDETIRYIKAPWGVVTTGVRALRRLTNCELDYVLNPVFRSIDPQHPTTATPYTGFLPGCSPTPKLAIAI